MKYRCRCNKRDCQTRRNLNKPPEQYVHPPKCRVIGCGGLMYLDKYRQGKGSKDREAECTDIWCDYNRETGNKNTRHRVSNKGCIGYEAYRIQCSLSQSKNSPLKPESSEEAPF